MRRCQGITASRFSAGSSLGIVSCVAGVIVMSAGVIPFDAARAGGAMTLRGAGEALQQVREPVDPVIEEPIRPLLPAAESAATPSACGSTPVLLLLPPIGMLLYGWLHTLRGRPLPTSGRPA
ncbi:MAG: hypothetical protein HY763_16725 [Planctomycetes bacterium]|nr:hypothetical protein [Planctomycetota bacterium]